MIIYIILINHKIWSVALLILIVFFDLAQCCEIGGHLRSIVLPSDAMWCNNRNRMSSWTPYPRNSRCIISRCFAIVFMGAAILEQQEQLAYKESFPTTIILSYRCNCSDYKCSVALPHVPWVRLVCSMWLRYFLIILTFYMITRMGQSMRDPLQISAH